MPGAEFLEKACDLLIQETIIVELKAMRLNLGKSGIEIRHFADGL